MIHRVALVGLGTMGPGIAARLARGGVAVRAHDIDAAAGARLEQALAQADAVLDSLGIEQARGGGVELAASLAEALDDAQLVIENVPERREIKTALYRDIEALVAPEVILATDTSGIPIGTLQEGLETPGRFVGMHWSNPPHIIPMIEVIGGARTARATVESVRDFIRALDLLPVVVNKDVPGFVENRVLYALLREAVDLVERGVIEPEDIDTCVSWGIGYKTAVIGPMALLDMAGLDIYRSVSSFLNRDLCVREDVSELVESRVADGRLGLKSGAGVYDYDSVDTGALQRERAAKLVAIRRILEGRG